MMEKSKKGGVVVVAISLIALLVALSSVALVLTSNPKSPASPGTREFYLITPEENFNETIVGIPHYIFEPTQITVNLGDDIVIHFYNTADDTHHTVTLPAYNVNVDLAPGQHRDIEFTATHAGVFQFYCTFHPQTMRGQLVVLSS